MFLGDFHQLPSISKTNAKDSGYWKHVFKVKFHTSWRSSDSTLLRKIGWLRKQVPKRSQMNTILRGHKAWKSKGPPTARDLRRLYSDHKNTTIAVCTRKGTHSINKLAAEVLTSKRKKLAELPCDWDANIHNFDDKGKLRTDRKPKPEMITIKKGLRLHLTRNLDKAGDFVNGMECEVLSWNPRANCLFVRTKTGKEIPVYQYTDPSPDAQNCSFFPVRLGYASTIYKLQGSELEHITIYLDVPGQPAAAYVALSRVKDNDSYLFGGQYTRNHFKPNA